MYNIYVESGSSAEKVENSGINFRFLQFHIGKLFIEL